MRYNTGNPVEPDGSSDPRDLYDNGGVLDKLLNGDELSWIGRLGKTLKTWAGMQDQVTQFLLDSGFESVHLIYGAGVVVERPTQLIERNGELYRVTDQADLPLTLSGTWTSDAPKLTATGNAALKQDLSNTTDMSKGVTYIGGAGRVVGSIALLRTMPKTGVKRAFVTAYNAGGSFGGGSYWLDEVDTTSADDGGSVIVNLSDGARWKLIFRDFLEAGQFGHDGLPGSNGQAPVQAAIIAMYNAGGGRVMFRGAIGMPAASPEILLYPNVKLEGAGLDKSYVQRFGTSKTAFRTFRPSTGYTPALCNAPGIIGFTLNGQSAGSGNIGIDLSNVRHAEIKDVVFANLQHGQFYNKYAGDTEVAFPYGQAFENQTVSCQFASCANSVTFRGAANRNTYIGNSYNSCTTAWAHDFANNFSETNCFINESVEGCNNVFAWPASQSQVYSQNFYGLTVENPSSNGFICTVKDPGRQNFHGLVLIPGNDSAVNFYQLFPGSYSLVSGTLGSSDRYSRGYRIPEEIWKIKAVRHIGSYGLSAGYSATLSAGAGGATSVTVPGAAIGDIVYVCADKDLLGCALIAHVSAANTVYVRIQNCTTAPVTLSSVTIRAVIEKYGATGPII
ncbi:hypothetical protein J3P89_19205 [Pseudomonas sp. Z1-14]|uniref:hypothetical protein n=1 Tax=Pseudomonas sp. Z1-14 TaxID=2817409 RepID=UPI003DA96F6D